MKNKKVDVDADVAELEIAGKAKRLIHNFLKEECASSLEVSPRRAAKRRKMLIRFLQNAVSEALHQGNPDHDTASTRTLAYVLENESRAMSANGKPKTSLVVLALSTSLRGIARR